MASTHKSLRSGTANKRPTTSIADGQIALNTNTTSPGLFFKDSTGATIIKVGPVHVGTTAPNASPAAGGSSGNSTGEVWLDTSLTPNGVKIWNGASWTNATPIGSTTVQGLLELATNAETQTGTDPDRAVTPAGLQSKVSDSTSTTSSTTIASSTAVKSAYDLANAALPKSGGTVTGNLEIGTTGSLSFEGATADAFETTIAVVDPTADRTITLPDTTGTVVTTGDTGTVTSTMIADGTIVNGDINASAAIDHSKLANITAGSVLLGNASNVPTATALSGDVTVNSTGVTAISSGVIVNADVNASAAIAGTKISPDFGSQTITTTGVVSAALGAAATPSLTFTGDLNTGIYSPGADQVAISTGGSGRLFITNGGNVGVGVSSPQGKLTVSNSGAEGIEFNPGYASGLSSILAYNRTTSAHTELGFEATQFPFRISGTERMRLDSSGRLGVGTSSPSTLFHVAGGRTLCQASNENYSLGVARSGSTNAYYLGINSNAEPDLLFSNNGGTTRMVLTNGGSLGIGTSSVASKLTVAGTQGNYRVDPDSVTNEVQLLTTVPDNSGFRNYRIRSNQLFLETSGSTALTIDTSQRVGIGTTSPSLKFVVSNGGAAGLEIDPTANASAPSILSYNRSGAAYTRLTYDALEHVFLRSGSEAARIDSSSRLLVGTSTNRNNLKTQVEGTTSETASLSVFRNSNDANPAILVLGKSRGTSVNSKTVVSSGDRLGIIAFHGSDGTQDVEGAYIETFVDGTPGANDMPSRLVFSTTADGASSPSERMRITSGGRFKCTSDGSYASIDTDAHGFRTSTDGNWALEAVHGIGSGSPYGIHSQFPGFNPNNTTSWFYLGSDSTNNRFIVYSNGGIANFQGNNVNLSDEREKKNIENLESTWDCLKHWELKKFHYNEDADTEAKRYGVIAQQVEEHCPEVISEWVKQKAEPAKLDDEGNELEPAKEEIVRMGVKEQQMYWMAIKALQEAQVRIEALEAEVAALKAQ